MVASLLITLREGLEAALIIGVVLGVLHRLQHRDKGRWVWTGTAAAAGLSAGSGVALAWLGVAFEGRAEEIFEGVTMLLAALMLSWMVFWMQRQGSWVQTSLEKETHRAVAGGSRWALFWLAFVAVLREGIETALFLNAAALNTTATQTLVGGAIGLVLAIGLGWLMFATSKRLNIRLFFRATSVLLLFFAAGLVARGAHDLQEAALLPPLIEQVWNINLILDEHSMTGLFLEGLFGYDGNPSLLQVLAYGAYWAVVSTASLRQGRKETHAVKARA